MSTRKHDHGKECINHLTQPGQPAFGFGLPSSFVENPEVRFDEFSGCILNIRRVFELYISGELADHEGSALKIDAHLLECRTCENAFDAFEQELYDSMVTESVDSDRAADSGADGDPKTRDRSASESPKPEACSCGGRPDPTRPAVPAPPRRESRKPRKAPARNDEQAS
jgi:hypothetical protein